jgi:hypothetical protein
MIRKNKYVLTVHNLEKLTNHFLEMLNFDIYKIYENGKNKI